MLGLISHLSVRNKLFFLSALPLLTSLFLGLIYLNELVDEKQAIGKARQLIDFAQVLNNLADEYAMERGLTAGFLGAGGQGGKAALLAQRNRTDKQEDIFQDWVGKSSSLIKSKSKSNRLDKLIAVLEGRTAIRSEVNGTRGDASIAEAAFSYYSEANVQTLSLIDDIALMIELPTLRVEFFNLTEIVWLKEWGGQSRGSLNAVFARGSASLVEFSAIQHYILSFEEVLAHSQRRNDAFAHEALGKFGRSTLFKEVQEYEQNFLKQYRNLDSIEGPTPEQWFSEASNRVAKIKSIEKTLIAHLIEHSEALAFKDSRAIGLVSVMLLSIAVVSLLTLIIVANNITSRIAVLKDVLYASTENHDLTVKGDESGSDEISVITHYVNNYLYGLGELIKDLVGMVVKLNEQTALLSGKAEDNQRLLSDQQTQTQVAASAMTQMSASISEVAFIGSKAANLSKDARASSQQGRELVEDTSKSVSDLSQSISVAESIINELSENSQNIGGILDTIRGIAEQTNLLALNAAIEAARAGEQGRGFAVVADEVRNLAQRTQESTAEIQQLIEALQASAGQATDNMNSSQAVVEKCLNSTATTAKKIEETASIINEVDSLIEQVSTATEEQSSVSNEVASNIEHISDCAVKSNESANQVRKGSESLAEMSKRLQKQTSVFKV